jgi:uncharacterized membrane protein YcaP (DUF421 family)
MFDLEISGFEIAFRTAIIYVALLFALRVGGKREIGQMTPFDLVVILLVSEAVQNSMVDGEMSVTGGLIAVAVLFAANYVLALSKERIPALRAVLESEPTVLVRDGRFLRSNMEGEGLTEDEVMSAVRLNGIEKLSGVRLAILEPDGAISVIPANDSRRSSGRRGPLGRRN